MRGFTIIEIVLGILLLAILSTVILSTVGVQTDASRYEETRTKLERIRLAILGNDSPDSEGHRTDFGYIGDMGNPPSSLESLVSQGTQPAWSFHPTYQIGYGWRGPYLSNMSDINIDAWGTPLVYNTGSITSLGADKNSGGSGYAKDMTVDFRLESWRATVQGVLAEGTLRYNNTPITLRYPLNGVLTSATSTTTASGYFTFTQIPFGIRVLEITSAPILAPRRIVIDRNQVLVPSQSSNFMGQGALQLESVTANGGIVMVSLKSLYRQALKIRYLTPSWNNTSLWQGFNITGGTNEAIASLGSSIKWTPRNTFTIPPNFSVDFIFTFSSNMQNARFVFNVEWEEIDQSDTIALAIP